MSKEGQKEWKCIRCGKATEDINVEIINEVMLHVGSTPLTWHGKLCNKCFENLDKKNIIEIEESIKKEFEIETK
jgi:hypothetical protein